MSVLYLTYIPLPMRPVRSSRASRQDLQKDKDSIRDGSENEKVGIPNTGAEEKSSVHGRDTEDWDTLRECVQVLSLCRVRDAMGTGMQPMMGYLRYVPPPFPPSSTLADDQSSQAYTPSCRPRNREILSYNLASPHSPIFRFIVDSHAFLS